MTESSHDRALTIGRLARAAGVGVETVRYYERRGLIARPERPSRGVRRYPGEAAAQIRFIREAQAFGFSLSEIAGLLALRTDDRASCADVRERAVAKLSEVREKIAGLRRLEGALEHLVAECPGKGSAEACTILEAFDSMEARPEWRNEP